jgi:hypothetical protein
MNLKNIGQEAHQYGDDDGQPDIDGTIGGNSFVPLPAGPQLIFGKRDFGNIIFFP